LLPTSFIILRKWHPFFVFCPFLLPALLHCPAFSTPCVHSALACIQHCVHYFQHVRCPVFSTSCVHSALHCVHASCVHSALRSLLLARALPCVQYFLRTFSTALRPCFLRAFSTAIITFSKCFALCSVLPACIQHCDHYFQQVFCPVFSASCVHSALRSLLPTRFSTSYVHSALHCVHNSCLHSVLRPLLPACIQHCVRCFLYMFCSAFIAPCVHSALRSFSSVASCMHAFVCSWVPFAWTLCSEDLVEGIHSWITWNR
jgi:hypothetical protein